MRRTARIAGLLYLLMAVFSAFGTIYVPSRLFVPGDAAATANSVMASMWLLRLGFVSDLVAQALFLFLVLTLYRLLKTVAEHQARLMVILVVASVPVTCLNLLNEIGPILLLGGAGYLKAFEPAQLQALAMVFLDLRAWGILIAQIFWGLWLLPLGFLVLRSGYFPRALGVLLMIACFGYLIGCLVSFLLPSYGGMVTPIAGAVSAVGEIAFLLWLLIKGAKLQRGYALPASA